MLENIVKCSEFGYKSYLLFFIIIIIIIVIIVIVMIIGIVPSGIQHGRQSWCVDSGHCCVDAPSALCQGPQPTSSEAVPWLLAVLSCHGFHRWRFRWFADDCSVGRVAGWLVDWFVQGLCVCGCALVCICVCGCGWVCICVYATSVFIQGGVCVCVCVSQFVYVFEM